MWTAALAMVRRVGMTPVSVAIRDWPYDSLNLILFSEAVAAFEELTLSGEMDQLKARRLANLFREARFLSAVDFVQADRLRGKVAKRWRESSPTWTCFSCLRCETKCSVSRTSPGTPRSHSA